MTVIEIIAVGREVLDGRVTDTNSVEIALALKKKGHIPRFGQRAGDVFEDLSRAFAAAEERSSFILVTGGLGPTTDDLTLEAFARYKGIGISKNEEAAAQVQARYAAIGRPLEGDQPEKLKQALLPSGSEPLANSCGTAPGVLFEDHGRKWFFLPGVPREMRAMLWDHVLPMLEENDFYLSRHWATQFVAESDLQASIREGLGPLPTGVEMLYRVKFPGVQIGLELMGHPELAPEFERISAKLESILGPNSYASAERGEDLETLEHVVIRLAESRGIWISTVESCTGGLVSSRLTDVPGASACFWGGSLTYDNRAKVQLGVDEALIKRHGAVSEPVALAMASAQLAKAKEAAGPAPMIAVSTTGIAGPDGGSPDKPVGLCFVAAATSWGVSKCVRVDFRYARSRESNKLIFSQHALELVRGLIGEAPAP